MEALTTDIKPAYYNPRDLATLLDVSIKTITKWTQDRRLPGALKCGHAWRYDRAAIDRARRSGVLLLPGMKKAV